MRRLLTGLAGPLILTTAVASAQMFVPQEVVVDPFKDKGLSPGTRRPMRGRPAGTATTPRTSTALR